MTGIHDTCACDQSSAEGRDHDEESPPDLALCIQNMQLSGEVDGKVKETSEGD
jgi:hypothetical protein